MAKPRATTALLLASGLLAALAASGASRPRTASPDPALRYTDRLRLVDSLAAAARLDSALALLPPLQREARRRGDRRALAQMLQTQAALSRRAGRDGRAPAREAIGLASAAGDTVTVMASLPMLAGETLTHDGLEEPALEWLLRLALNRDDYRAEGVARAEIAHQSLLEGRPEEARRGYTRAIELSRQAGDWRNELDALAGMGDAHFALGQLDQARDDYFKSARLGEERQAVYEEAAAYDALGDLERTLGDPERAVEHYRRALGVARHSDDRQRWIPIAIHEALGYAQGSHVAEAESTLRATVAACDSLRQTDGRARALVRLAAVESEAGRPAEQAAAARLGLQAGRALAPERRAELALALASALGDQDSAGAGLAALEREARVFRGRVPRALDLEVESERGELLDGLGRGRDALAAFGRADRLAGGLAGWMRVRTASAMARAELAQGHLDRASARVADAMAAWEADRAIPLDPDERERRDAARRALVSTLAEVMLAPLPGTPVADRVPAVYDALARLEARARVERALGPNRLDALPPALSGGAPSADSLRHTVLRDDDVLLDAALGARGSYLFAITRDSLRVARLPRDRELERSVAALRIGSPPESTAADTTLGGLDSLLTGVADLVRAKRRVIFVPDGALAGLPLEALRLDPGGPPLAESHEVVRVPSTGLLARLRAGHLGDTARVSVLALAGIDDEQGAASAGARREVRSLGGRFQRVEVEILDHTSMAPERLAEFGLLHLAGRARVDDRHPWHSGLLLSPDDRPDRDPYLRAAALAALHLRARLAVLSGFVPSTTPAASGQGVQGLATGLLSAGVPSVVATLWDVEDPAGARLINGFYDALSRGQTVAEAVRATQAALRADPATRHPYYWAGLVVIGDPETRVRLQPKPRWLWPVAAAAGIVIFGAGLFFRRRSGAEA